MSNLLTWIADRLITRRRQRIEAHLRVHRAELRILKGAPVNPPLDCYFLNVWNSSPESRIQVTHVWIEVPGGPHTAVLTRPLPVTIEPQEQWETWIEARLIPSGVVVEDAARAQLANRTVVRSVAREGVPPAGAVPG